MFLKRCWAISFLLVFSLLCAAKDRHAEGSLSVELSAPFETVIQVVSETAADGIIRGTAEYQTETQISGAVPAETSTLLRPADTPGAHVFYKVRTGAISPRHYNNSNDAGTVVVAYILEKLPEEKSRLTIESVFVPDSHHGRSASDGSVEACEFTAIETRLKTLAEAKLRAREQQEREAQQVRIRTLRRKVADQQGRFDALNAEAQQLEKRSAELRQLALVRAKSNSARLRAAPYVRANTLQSLTQGEELDVLYRTASWYKVRTVSGQTGWIYVSLVEPAQ